MADPTHIPHPDGVTARPASAGTYHLLILRGGIEPDLSADLGSYDAVLDAARRHCRDDAGEHDGVFAVSVSPAGTPAAFAFARSQVSPEFADDWTTSEGGDDPTD